MLERTSLTAVAVAFLAISGQAIADHNGLHTTPCNEPETVGGGALGNSAGAADPVGPPNSLGWSVGSGQCNGSFTVTRDADFPSATGGGIELGLRIEQRSVGQVERKGQNDYEVQLGNDTTAGALNRAWWNFHHSIAYDGDIDELDALSFTIRTDAGANVPVAPVFDMLALRAIIDARNNQPNPTTDFSDLYQTSQNPEFDWFTNSADDDANPNGDFDYDEEGAWLLTLAAEENGERASVSICVHTPNAACLPDHLQCYDVNELDSLGRQRVSLEDQFGFAPNVTARRARQLCAPASKNGEGIFDSDTHYVCYDIAPKDSADVEVVVSNQFGEQALRVRRNKTLCVPSTKEVIGDASDDDDDDDDD